MRYLSLLALLIALYPILILASPLSVRADAAENEEQQQEQEQEKPPKPAETKYFHEPGGDDIMGHYDTRFFHGVVSYDERTDTLTHMIRAYLEFFRENGLETWIAHGTLLGWWWNGKMLPWDWDVDTQVSEETLLYMGDHFNQTIAQYISEDRKVKRRYLLDVNPWSRQRDRGEGLNIIDARWIDIRNGLYIDITGLSELHPDVEPGVWQCKNFHKYNTEDLYPMRQTTYEGVPAKVPFKYDSILIAEYSGKALSSTHFQNHTWSPEQKIWVADEPHIAERQKQEEKERKKQLDEEKRQEDRQNQYA
ncbi:hypothetical protein DTO164E3_1131 [Paecilomyces variotii]|nr:hypothetical protein DTO164E3_1131 [Paecilomyces variotii]KAJ9355732.1 hypothetical protein DTO280E4_6410 [Paecilomyces variotii]